MKAEENQGFTSFDFFTLVLSMAIIVGVSAPIIKKNFQPDNSLETAKRELGQIGQSVLNPKVLNQMAQNYKAAGERAIASVENQNKGPVLDLEAIQNHLKNGEWQGDVGMDPWGKPYHFAFLRNSEGVHTHVAVWSSGPNKSSDTNIENNGAVISGNFEFKGDDVGQVIPIR